MVLWGLSGCASAPQAVGLPEAQAQVWVENHTDWSWQVAFDAVDSTHSNAPVVTTTGGWLTIEPRARREVRLAGGTYQLRRGIILTGEVGTEVAQSDETDTPAQIELAAGQTYTWPLATYLSQEAGYP